ncbi:MAG: D-arabinono-1,4-lactone oxidase [Bacteroidia bacterium]|nr:D-arabinono-1,4-lactone oxidase [Bacteroidia bacterium]
MRNWSGSVQWQPTQVLKPDSEQSIQEIVQKAAENKQSIRLIGTGHSFTRLCETNEILMSLDNYQGLISVDKDKMMAKVKGGTKLHYLGELLYAEGLAMENLGDIDVQSIAGTISTGTHGTGTAFGTISTQVKALKFVNGRGEIISCSELENKELFKAAQVSMGALGVITEVSLQCVPAYKLELWNRQESLEEVLGSISERNEQNRNFEFYCFPYSNRVWTKSSNKADAQADKDNIINTLTEYVLENYAFKVLCELARFFPSQNKAVSKISVSSIPTLKKVKHSHKVYATKRLVRFNEMEYNIPAEVHGEVIKEVLKVVSSGKYPVHFPIENRFVRADDIYMSPAYGRDSAYIACHMYNKKDCKPFFKELEEIFKAYGGRPHWGKMNTFSAEDVRNAYPEFDTFLKHRKEQDPNGVFLNDYLRGLFGVK